MKKQELNKFQLWLKGWFHMKLDLTFQIIVGGAAFIICAFKSFGLGMIISGVLMLGRKGLGLVELYLRGKGDIASDI